MSQENDFKLCTEPGGDVICNYCIRNPDNTPPNKDSKWIKPDWKTFDGYCKYWLKYSDKDRQK